MSGGPGQPRRPRGPAGGQWAAAPRERASVSLDRSRQWLQQALAARRISRVQPNMARSGDLVNHARAHVRSAGALAEAAPTLALAACHDALRKSIDAHAGARGYRFENAPGAHRSALEYARQVLGGIAEADLYEAERLRTRRHDGRVRRSPLRPYQPPGGAALRRHRYQRDRRGGN